MNSKFIYILLSIISSGIVFSSNLLPILNSTDIERQSNSVYIIGIMVEFEPEIVDDPRTTGNGTFLKHSNIDSLVNCFNSQDSRCSGFLIDPPPHNSSYFESQIEAVKNYYLNTSYNNISSFEYHVIDSVYQLDRKMAEYSELSNYNEPEQSIALLYSDGLELASDEIEDHIYSIGTEINDILIVMFHAGVGEDYTFEGYLDPANYDIRSGYIEETMLGLVPESSWMKQNNIDKGILLPEGLNLIYYETIEDIYGCSENFLCDAQIGMTGLFSYLLGYEFGLSEMFNRNSGQTGIGQFGLMDVGSFNLRGVIPAPPNPWSRIQAGWNQAIINDFSNNSPISINKRYSGFANQNDSTLFRLNISNSEYYLIENIDNKIIDNLSFEDIQYADSLNGLLLPDSVVSIFDKLLFIDGVISYGDECNENFPLTIDNETNVIVCSNNYDYGLPGSGLAIWHIDESNLENLNDNINQRTVKIVEADGAQDIGSENYLYPIANPSLGWKWDLWFPDNEAYFFVNPTQNRLSFNSNTLPSSRNNLGVRSYINLYDIKYTNNSSRIEFYPLFEQDLFIPEMISDSLNFEVVGSGLYDNSGYIIINNHDASEFQRVFSNATIPTGLESLYEENYFSVIDDEFNIQSCLDNSYYDFAQNDCVSLSNYIPKGYFETTDSLVNYSSWDEDWSYDKVAVGDIDLDGFDELLILIENESIECYEANGIRCNNFPIKGDFFENIIIADIVDDIFPEIIVREGELIHILSNNGIIVNSIPSDSITPLYLVPNWGNYINLVDGNRSLLFNQRDIFNGYWLNPGGLSNNLPHVNPLSIHNQGDAETKTTISEFYNYPNPVTDYTTFRFFLNSASSARLKIYTSSGFLIEDIKLHSIHENQYNEINLDLSSYSPGVYIANLTSYSNNEQKDSKIIKVLVIDE